MKWKDVFKAHRAVSAVYTKDEEVKSILFSDDYRRRRKNYIKDEKKYLVIAREKETRKTKSILRMCKAGKVVNVFVKKGPDSWENDGKHVIEELILGKDEHGEKSIIIVLNRVQ